MTNQTLRALAEKLRKQTEDGIDQLLRSNADTKAQLKTLVDELRTPAKHNACLVGTTACRRFDWNTLVVHPLDSHSCGQLTTA